MTFYRNITIAFICIMLPFLAVAKGFQAESMFMIQADGETVSVVEAPAQLAMGEQLVYEHVYNNIDLVVYPALNAANETVIRYEFVIFPGGNPAHIVAPASDITRLEATQELGGFEATPVAVNMTETKSLQVASYEQAHLLIITMDLAQGDSLAVSLPTQK